MHDYTVSELHCMHQQQHLSMRLYRLGKYCRAAARPPAATAPTVPAMTAALGPLTDLNNPAVTKPAHSNMQYAFVCQVAGCKGCVMC